MDKSENWKNQCLQINAGLPTSGLYSSQQRHTHSESNAPWRISPTPFFISDDEIKKNKIKTKPIEELYKKPQFGDVFDGIPKGWPVSNKIMEEY